MHLVCPVGQVGGTGQVALQVPFWQRLVPVGQLMGPGPQLAWHVRSAHRFCPTGQSRGTGQAELHVPFEHRLFGA